MTKWYQKSWNKNGSLNEFRSTILIGQIWAIYFLAQPTLNEIQDIYCLSNVRGQIFIFVVENASFRAELSGYV